MYLSWNYSGEAGQGGGGEKIVPSGNNVSNSPLTCWGERKKSARASLWLEEQLATVAPSTAMVTFEITISNGINSGRRRPNASVSYRPEYAWTLFCPRDWSMMIGEPIATRRNNRCSFHDQCSPPLKQVNCAGSWLILIIQIVEDWNIYEKEWKYRLEIIILNSMMIYDRFCIYIYIYMYIRFIE